SSLAAPAAGIAGAAAGVASAAAAFAAGSAAGGASVFAAAGSAAGAVSVFAVAFAFAAFLASVAAAFLAAPSGSLFFLIKLRTVSDGCAPLLIQYSTRSSLSVLLLPRFFGSYVPMISINFPSRG